jgi:hypothetical protein
MDTPPVNHEDYIAVNLRGVPEHPGTSATLTLLSEGETFCDECGKRVDGLAVYVTRERPERRSGYELTAIVHRECFRREML